MPTDSVERLLSPRLVGWLGVANVVAGLPTGSASVRFLSATADLDERTHASLAPARGQSVGRQIVGSLAALLQTSVRALLRVCSLEIGPIGQCLADAVPVQVGLVGLKADELNAFCAVDGADGFWHQMKGVQSDLLATQSTFCQQFANRRPLAFFAAVVVGLPRDLLGLVGQGRDASLARAADRPLVARQYAAP